MESLKPTFDSAPASSSSAAVDSFEPQIGRSVSIEQAAQVLGVSRRTVYNRIRDGRLQTIRTLGGSQRVLMASLEEHLKPAPDQSADKVEKEEEEGQELAAAGQ